MSNDVLITPASRKIEFKDSSANVDAKIETDASGNLLITNAGGDISIGDTSSDVFIGDGTNNVDIVFEQDGEIRGTSGVTLTLGASGSSVAMATDLSLGGNDITNVGDLTVTGNLTITGDINSYNVTDLDVTDKTITLGVGQTEANSGSSGIIIDGSAASMLWDEADNRFEFNKNIYAPVIYGSGAGITSLNATNISSGTLANARLPDLTVSDFAGSAIQTGSESFADSDTALMTAAAVQDKILSYGYTTNVGDVTAVTASSPLAVGGGAGPTPNITFSSATITTSTSDADGDFFLVHSGTTSSGGLFKLTKANINLSGFNNDSGFLTSSSGLNASNLTSGTVPSARLSLSASDIPNLAASKITSGTFADARIAASSITQHTDSKYLRSDVSDVYAGRTLSFGIVGNGTNTNGSFFSIEGNTDSSGEGSGRIFFREHNSSTAGEDNYGMSLGYRGGATTITTAGGNSNTTAALVSNGQWFMVGHDASNQGALIMYGDRAATFVNFASNNITGVGNITLSGTVDGVDIAARDSVLTSTTTTANAALPKAGGTLTGDLTIPNKIIHSGDTDTYFQFEAADQARIVAGNNEITEWRSDRMQMNKSITFLNWNNFSDTALSNIAYDSLNAPIHIPAVNVGSADAYLPILQGSAQHTQGYRTNYVLGGFKQGTTGAGWGDGQSGFFMAMGGSDTVPTKEFRFTWDGRIWYTDAGSSTYLDFDTSNKLKFIASGGQKMEIAAGGTTFNDNVALGGNQLENIGSAYFNEYLYHNGDTDTYIRIQDNSWTFRTGGGDRLVIDNTNLTVNADLILSAENTTGDNSIHLPRGGEITFYGDSNSHHSIASTNNSNSVTDDLRISSYGALYVDLDSNDNNTSGADFVIARHNSTAALLQVDGETGAGKGLHSYPNATTASGVSLMVYSQGTVPIDQGVVQIRSNGKTGWADGDEMGSVDFYTADGSGVSARNVARMVAVNSQGNGSTTTTMNGEIHFYTSPYNSQLNAAPVMRLTESNSVIIGDGTDASSHLEIRPADDGTADDIQFYNGSTRMGEIGTQDTTWLRINQSTSKNIYTPRYIRADAGFFVDDTTKGINGSGNFIGGTITGASDANVSNWDTAYGWGNHASAGYAPTANPTFTGTITNAGTITTGSAQHQMNTPYGYIEIGPKNTTWGHIYTDRANFYFNKQLYVLGDKVWNAGNDGSGSGLDADTLDGVQLDKFLQDNGAEGDFRNQTSGSIGSLYLGHTPTSNTGSSMIACVKQTNTGQPGSIRFYISPANTTNSTATTYLKHEFQADGDFHADGDVIAYSTTTGSDRKLKKNIRDLEGSLDKTLKLRGVKFDWKDENKANDQLGFIAQEVEEVLPEVVKEVETLTKEGETHLTVNYPAVVPLLVEAIKEQQSIINRLEERLSDLENKLK